LDVLSDEALEDLVSTAYQASLLRDEERPVTFRLLLREPDALPPYGGPPTGFHPLRFDEPRPFDEEELRRLAPAAKLQRSLIGVRVHHGGLQIWGLVHSGPGWLRTQQGGRTVEHQSTDALVLTVSGPGRLHAALGDQGVGTIVGGRLVSKQIDVFESQWLRDAFRSVRGEIEALHLAQREPTWAPVASGLAGRIAQNFVRRIVATIRVARHGGTVLVVPPSFAEERGAEDGPNEGLRMKYTFAHGIARRRYRELIVRAMNTLASTHAGRTEPVGWSEWNQSTAREIMAIDEGIFELAHVIAALSDVDGATVVTQRFEVVGFGAEIGAGLPHVPTVMRALDQEGTNLVGERTDGVGTRHRSAYRFCAAHPEAIAIVVSQDGVVRFVKKKDEQVTYWEHASSGGEA
jgi:hypothetical protein